MASGYDYPISASRGRAGLWLALAAIGLGSAAIVNDQMRRSAEARNPARGRFVTVRGLRLHYTETGHGPPLIILPGNGMFSDEAEISGLVRLAARNHRVIVIDRPGFGYSDRSRGKDWSARAQAALIGEALGALNVERAVVFGHSWGTLVALALAVDRPGRVAGLVLASGFYYPENRLDAWLMVPSAMPVVGDVLRWTLAPPIGRLMTPRVLADMFAPQSSERFAERFPVELAMRPAQLRALAEDGSGMSASAASLVPHYRSLSIPVAILAGDADRIVDHRDHAERLHRDIPHSKLEILQGVGHMLHHHDPERVVRAIEEIANATSSTQRRAVNA